MFINNQFENAGSVGNEAAMSLIQKFWVSAMTIASSEEDDDSRRYPAVICKQEVLFIPSKLLINYHSLFLFQ